MSAVELSTSSPTITRWGTRLFARLEARAVRLLAADEAADPSWAAAFAAAPQVVPRLPRPRQVRLTRIVVGLVIAAHAVLLLMIVRQAMLAPPPQQEMTVELVRQMPEAPRKAAPPREKPDAKKAAPEPQPTKQETKKQDAQKPARQPPKAQRPPPRKPAAEQEAHDKAGPMPAIALPGASGAGTDAVAYQQLVLSQVAKAKKQGRYMGVPGYAGVRFRVAEDGSLESVKLAVSSGDPALDIEAEAMIRRAAPFPPPPPGGRRDYGITLVFQARP